MLGVIADRAAVVAEVVPEFAWATRVRQKLAYRLNLVKKCDARSNIASTYACKFVYPTPICHFLLQNSKE